MSERVRASDAPSVSLHLCACFLLLLSSSCLYSTVPTSRDPVFHLFDIKSYYSLHPSAAASICLPFCLSVSLSDCIVFSCAQAAVDQLLWCVGAQTDYTVETDSSVCVCACVDVLEGALVFVWCLCHQSNLVLMILGLAPASNSVRKECVWMHVCVSACMFMVVGATGHWLGPTRSCPVGIGLDVTAPPFPMVCESITDSKTVTTSFLEHFPLFK